MQSHGCDSLFVEACVLLLCLLPCTSVLFVHNAKLSWLSCCTWPILCMNYEPNPTHTQTPATRLTISSHWSLCSGLFPAPLTAASSGLRVTLLEIALGKVACFAQEFFPCMCSFVMFSADRKLTWPDLTHSLALLLGCVLHIITPFQATEPGRLIFDLTVAMVQDRTRLAADSEDIQRHPNAWQRGCSF